MSTNDLSDPSSVQRSTRYAREDPGNARRSTRVSEDAVGLSVNQSANSTGHARTPGSVRGGDVTSLVCTDEGKRVCGGKSRARELAVINPKFTQEVRL